MKNDKSSKEIPAPVQRLRDIKERLAAVQRIQTEVGEYGESLKAAVQKAHASFITSPSLQVAVNIGKLRAERDTFHAAFEELVAPSFTGNRQQVTLSPEAVECVREYFEYESECLSKRIHAHENEERARLAADGLEFHGNNPALEPLKTRLREISGALHFIQQWGGDSDLSGDPWGRYAHLFAHI